MNKERADHILAVREFKVNGITKQKRITIPLDSTLKAGDYVLVSKIDPIKLDLLKDKIVNVEFTNKSDVAWQDLKKRIKENETSN